MDYRGFVLCINFDINLVLLEKFDYRFSGMYRLSPFKEGCRKYDSLLRNIKRLSINFKQADIEDADDDPCNEFWLWLEISCPLIEEFAIICDSRVNYEHGAFSKNAPPEMGQLWMLSRLQRALSAAQKKGILRGLKFKVMTRA
jgi:hypothetical protein